MTAWWRPGLASTYSTAVGEQRSLTLEDGSVVELNSRSRIAVRISSQERAIDLLEGQAYFRVSKDIRRPFVVHSENARVRAVGTAFDVYRTPGTTRVTVVEGKVEVTPGGPGMGSHAVTPMPVGAGEQAIVTAQRVARSAVRDVGVATAWIDRQMVFDFTPLAEVIAEFNRYNSRQIIVEDAVLEQMRISGVFSSTDAGSLIRFLEAQPGLQVQQGGARIRVVSSDDR